MQQEVMNEEPTATADESTAARKTAPPAAWKRGFWSLFAAQFQGAFSDNVFKFLGTGKLDLRRIKELAKMCAVTTPPERAAD
jgi:hypothetical protein